jgi:hypothetical protein
LKELTVGEAGDDDFRRADLGVGKAVPRNQVFVIESAGRRYVVVAAAVKASENDLDIFESSLEPFWASEAGVLSWRRAFGAVLLLVGEHDDGFLKVHDEAFKGDQTRMERYLVCDTCGARSVLLMRVPMDRV